MSRLVAARLLLFAVLGAVTVLLSSASAQGATSAVAGTIPGAITTGHQVLYGPQDVWRWVYYGDTYPDTSAGLAACDAEGQSLIKAPINNYSCMLGNPNAGVYNLWVLYHIVTD
jgi:hypothetical protein